jgi:thiamine-phosphate pyrophosphorylase
MHSPETSRRGLRGLYAVTPTGLAPGILLQRVEQALAGGVALVQYRDKSDDRLQRATTAGALVTLCHRFGARLIVNDDLVLALAIDADGVHLGEDDGDLATARWALGFGKLLGASCYADFERARNAASVGVDYVAFGAVFASPTKPEAERAPLSLFARCRQELHIPCCAIGGITLANAPTVLAAGADLLAVVTDLFDAPDIASRAAGYRLLFEEK